VGRSAHIVMGSVSSAVLCVQEQGVTRFGGVLDRRMARWYHVT
jgi:hypothetical protein